MCQNEFAYMHEKETVQSEINWALKEKGENGGVGKTWMEEERTGFVYQSFMGEKWGAKQDLLAVLRVQNGSVIKKKGRCEHLYVHRHHLKVQFL